MKGDIEDVSRELDNGDCSLQCLASVVVYWIKNLAENGNEYHFRKEAWKHLMLLDISSARLHKHNLILWFPKFHSKFPPAAGLRRGCNGGNVWARSESAPIHAKE
ncbi:hypothetical protein TNCV_4025841 [Trichonephila clavipes]|nr:hypothetical protein TNCV_4025841 [Trichonephila clavipes]